MRSGSKGSDLVLFSYSRKLLKLKGQIGWITSLNKKYCHSNQVNLEDLRIRLSNTTGYYLDYPSPEILDTLDHFCEIILRHCHSRMSILHMNHSVLLYVLISLRRNERPPTSAANHFCHCSFIVLCERLQYILFSNICFSVFIPNESRCRMSMIREIMHVRFHCSWI